MLGNPEKQETVETDPLGIQETEPSDRLENNNRSHRTFKGSRFG